MNTANKLTVSRFGMVFIMTFFLTFPIPFGKTLALLTFMVAALTDYWDGRLARNRYGMTAFGQLMDPLADKALICAAFICFAALDQIVPAWIVIIIITREFMVTGLRLLAANKGHIIVAGTWGKHKTVWQIVVIIVVMLGLSLREDIFPMILKPDVLQNFLSLYYDCYFGYITFMLSALAAILTVVSGTIYFYQCKGIVISDV